MLTAIKQKQKKVNKIVELVHCYFFYRVGRFKLIEGSPGNFNGWTPLPPLAEKIAFNNISLPKLQLFDIESTY